MACDQVYPQNVVDQVLAYTLEHGIVEASVEYKIPRNTVWRWARKHGILETVPPKQTAAQSRLREEFREALLEQAMDMLERMNEPHVDYRGKDVEKVEWDKAPSADCRNYAVAAAVLIDKYRLELGESTDHAELGPDEVTRQAKAIMDEFSARRAQKAS